LLYFADTSIIAAPLGIARIFGSLPGVNFSIIRIEMSESNAPDNRPDADNVANKRDYSCEIIAVLVLLSLSALSHFWLLAFAAGVLLSMWGFVLLMMRAWNLAALRVEFRRSTPAPSPSAPQVFRPEKIRPSVDC
jgi:hypothetical protein